QHDGVSGSDPHAASSSYQRVQFKYDKRFSGGLTVLTHCTWSRMMDDMSITDGNLAWLGGTTSFQNPLDLSAERSLSQHDVEHRFVATGDWQLPFGRERRFGSGVSRVAGAVIGGWEVSAFFQLEFGFPVQVPQAGGTVR